MVATQGIQTAIGRGVSGGDVFDIADDTIEVSNSVVDTVMYEVTIPPNVLVARSGVVITAHGDYLNNSGGAARLQLTVDYGETEVYRGQSAVLATDVDLRSWFMELKLLPIGGILGQRLFGMFKVSDAQTPNTGVGKPELETISGPFGGVASEDSSLGQPLVIKLKHDVAHANIRWRRFLAYTEYIG